MHKLKLAFVTTALITTTSIASAHQCPVDSGNLDAVHEAILGASGCSAAAEVAKSCAWGSSVDVHLVEEAIGKCSPDFERIGNRERQGYELLLQRCEAKFADHQGTMYRSMAAFCRLEVTEAFSSAYGPVED